MISSSSTVYKLSDGSEIFDSESELDETTSEILVTIQNNLVDLHSLGCYLLLALAMVIGVGVISCWKK